MLLRQAIVEYGVQTGQAGAGTGGWGQRLPASSPAMVWALVGGAGLVGLWLLLGRSSGRGFGVTRLVGLALLLGAAYVGSERLGLTHLGWAR